MAKNGASIGAMRHKVIIQQVTSTTDAGGGRSVAWSNYKTVFAHVEQLSAQVKFDQGVVDERGLYRFTMRFLTGVDTRNRLSFCLLYTSPSPRDRSISRMPSSA